MITPNIVQMVLGSGNLPLTKHLYTTVFGFAGTGERLSYGERLGSAMQLGSVGGATVLYLVGRQELVQLEFWTISTPPQRPLPAEWRPNDIGFCRLGISVADFAGSLDRHRALSIHTLTQPMQVRGLWRVCFRDPTTGIPVEIMEEGDGLPGARDRYHELDAAVVYASVSVTDLEEALGYFRNVVGLEPADCDLHDASHEALWGLPNAGRRVAWLRGGTVFLELVQYLSPVGRPRPLDDGLDRQGFKTIGVGYRDPAMTGEIFRRVKEAGLNWTIPAPASHIGGNHVVGAVAHHMKTLSVPHEVERQFGYSPEPAKWWTPPPSATPS